MRPAVLNRVIMLLCFAGLYVAGFLSIGKAMDFSLPCSSGQSCDVVQNHSSSQWFGVPVAFVGLGAYLVLTVLAILRDRMGMQQSKGLAYAGWAISGVGMLISFYLQYVSINEIQARCDWCIASAAIMFFLFVLHAWLAQMDAPADERGHSSPLVPLALSVILIATLGFSVNRQLAKERDTGLGQAAPDDTSPLEATREVLVPEGAHVRGSLDSPVIIVEFADLLCPTCQRSFPEMTELQEKHPGKVAWVFRHFPLYNNPKHRMSIHGATLAEYAASKGKFWEYMEKAMQLEPESVKTPGPFIAVAQQIGLDSAEAEKHVTNPKESPFFDRAYKDLNTGERLRIQQTPTFFLIAKDRPIQAYSNRGLREFFQSPEGQALLK